MRIGVVGCGVVGRATARAYLEHVDEVRVHDVVRERATHTLAEVLECDLIFVALPTPQREDSLQMSLSAIREFFQDQIPRHARDRNYVLRSTVPVGTTRRLSKEFGLHNLVFSPEFLTARVAVTDAQMPARNIVGLTGNGYNAPELRGLYARRFPGVPVLTMSSDESEAVKLFLNSFFAVKIAFFNEIRTLADKLGLDWDTVLAGMLSDGRIAHSHTQVPGHQGYGFSGTCLPKDLACLIDQMDRAELNPWVTRSALERNRYDRQR